MFIDEIFNIQKRLCIQGKKRILLITLFLNYL